MSVQTGWNFLKALAEYIGRPIPVLQAGGEGLPECRALREGNHCLHEALLFRTLTARCGEQWSTTSVAELLWEFNPGDCCRIDLFTFQVFWQLIELLDMQIKTCGFASCNAGLPVHVGKARSRRLTKHWMSSLGVGVIKTNGKKMFAEHAPRDSNSMRAEGLGLGRYHASLALAVSTASHVAVAPDGLAAPVDMLNCPIALPLQDRAGWMPVQVLEGMFCLSVFVWGFLFLSCFAFWRPLARIWAPSGADGKKN